MQPFPISDLPLLLAYIDPSAGGLLFQIIAPVLILIVAGWHLIQRAFLSAIGKFGAWFKRKK